MLEEKEFWKFKWVTDEQPIAIQIDRLSFSNALWSIKWIVPFMLSKDTDNILTIHDYNLGP
jgi:hypothetical protein